MKYFSIIIATLLLACTNKETPRNEKAELDSLGRHYWNRELRTARAATYNGGKFPLPETLYGGTRQDFKDDSVYFADLLQKLRNINVTKLPSSALVDFDLLKWIAEMRLEATYHYNNVFPNVTPYASQFSSADMAFKQAGFKTKADVTQYLKLLSNTAKCRKANWQNCEAWKRTASA